MEKTYTPNETQKAFLEELASREDKSATLFELKLEGKEFKSGTVNGLVAKGYLTIDPNKREYECDVVFNGVKVGKVTKTASVYRLVKQSVVDTPQIKTLRGLFSCSDFRLTVWFRLSCHIAATRRVTQDPSDPSTFYSLCQAAAGARRKFLDYEAAAAQANPFGILPRFKHFVKQQFKNFQ